MSSAEDRENKPTRSAKFRGVFRRQSNIYDEAFGENILLLKASKHFSKKNSIMVV